MDMRKLFVVLAGSMLSCLSSYAIEGEGTERDPYRIATVEDLYEFAAIMNGKNPDEPSRYNSCAILEADIVVNENVLNEKWELNQGDFRVWDPIDPPSCHYFGGVFDGNGKSISGLYLDNTKAETKLERVGFFATNRGEIRNLTIKDSYFSSGSKTCVGGISAVNTMSGVIDTCRFEGFIDAYEYAGAIVGKLENDASIERSSSSGQVKTYMSCSGGIAGYAYRGIISKCHSDAYVHYTQNYLGGICGYEEQGGKKGGVISHCSFSGTISPSPCCNTHYMGGICGFTYGSITDCVNYASFSGEEYVGGIVGSGYGNLVSCHNYGDVKGEKYVGGLSGLLDSEITDSHNEGSVQGGTPVGGLVGDYKGRSVTRCFNLGSVSSIGTPIGGLTGVDYGYGKYYDCYNLGDIYNEMLDDAQHYQTDGRAKEVLAKVGGICGVHSGTYGFLDCCYNAGRLTMCKDTLSLVGLESSVEIQNSYYLIDRHSFSPEAKILDQFMSGEVAYLLQKGKTEEVWGQEIGVDSFPRYKAKKVYSSEICSGRYSNKEEEVEHVYNAYCQCIYCGLISHHYDNCVCSLCGFRDHSCSSEHRWMEISTLEDLFEFADSLNAGHANLYVRLMNDIVVNTEDWDGYSYTRYGATTYSEFLSSLKSSVKRWNVDDNAQFTGIFDGQGHVIKGLCLTSTGFIPKAAHATIKNLAIEECLSISGVEEPCGMICGQADQCEFVNCHVSGRISALANVAGIVGGMRDCSFERCYNLAKVEGGLMVGGLACALCDSERGLGDINFEKCWNSGTLSNRSHLSIGGLASLPDCDLNKVYVSNSYNVGEITAMARLQNESYAGGLLGGPLNKRIFLANCYNAGLVQSYYLSAVGELVGNYNGTCDTKQDQNEFPFDPSSEYLFFDSNHIYYHNCYYAYECKRTESLGCEVRHPDHVGFEKVDMADFRSGKVCYLLNKGVTDGTQAYYQNLADVRLRSSESSVEVTPNLNPSSRAVYYDGNTYYNLEFSSVSDEKSCGDAPLVRVENNRILVGNVRGEISIVDMKGLLLYSREVKREGSSDWEEFPIRQPGVYALLFEGKAYKIVVQ